MLAAHETGCHVQTDLDPAWPRTADALRLAAADGDHDMAQLWARWHREAFADAFAVLSAGPAAVLPIAELEYAPPRRLLRLPAAGRPVPPLAVRLALHAEVASAAGLPAAAPRKSSRRPCRLAAWSSLRALRDPRVAAA